MNKKKDEHNLFTTKNYVSIQTLHVYNWEVCVNWNTTCLQSRGMCQSKHHISSLRGMFSLGIETIWGCTFSIPF
jgi:hypothetical protein